MVHADYSSHDVVGDTHSFGESQRAHTSLKCSQTDDLQSRQTDAVPDTNMRLQRLSTGTDRLVTTIINTANIIIIIIIIISSSSSSNSIIITDKTHQMDRFISIYYYYY